MTMSIHDACRTGDLDTVRKLVASDPALVDVDDQHQWRPIFHAALERHIDVVRFLIESGADLAAHDGYVLHYAGEVPDNKDIVGLLVTYGALDAHVRPKDDLSRQFLASLFLGDHVRVRSMLNRHPQLATAADGRGDYPIHHAARNGDIRIVLSLIDHNADVNAENERGHTVLYCAGGHGHFETVRMLLQNNADPTVRFTKDGKTLIEWLAQYPDDGRFVKVSQLLSEHLKGAESKADARDP